MKLNQPIYIATATAFLILISVIAWLLFEKNSLESDLAQSQQDNRELNDTNQNLTEELEYTSQELEISNEQLVELRTDLDDVEENFERLSDQVGDALGTVDTWEQLQKIDEELLKKYSRIAFLNENYVPEDLSGIDEEWLYNTEKELEVKSEVEPFLEEMLEDAEDDDMELKIISAYRSFRQQSAIKSNYVITYGQTTANQFSADQGFSEHQLGTTIDFTTPSVGSNFSEFKNTDEYEWLVDNAHEYGFTLSYPEGNAYYISEPWHWRFVGIELASDLEDDGANFYDWGQRRIDEYLIDIFED